MKNKGESIIEIVISVFLINILIFPMIINLQKLNKINIKLEKDRLSNIYIENTIEYIKAFDINKIKKLVEIEISFDNIYDMFFYLDIPNSNYINIHKKYSLKIHSLEKNCYCEIEINNIKGIYVCNEE